MDGVVIGTMTTTRGKERYAVEHEPYGIIHIYNESNLELKEREFKIGDDVEGMDQDSCEWVRFKYVKKNGDKHAVLDEHDCFDLVAEVRAINDTSK